MVLDATLGRVELCPTMDSQAHRFPELSPFRPKLILANENDNTHNRKHSRNGRNHQNDWVAEAVK